MDESDETLKWELQTLLSDLSSKTGVAKISHEVAYLKNIVSTSNTLHEYRLRILALNQIFYKRSWPYLSEIDAGVGFWSFFGLAGEYLEFCQSVYDKFFEDELVSDLMKGVSKLLASCQDKTTIPFGLLGALIILLTGKPIIDSGRFNHPHVAQLTLILLTKRTISGIYFYDTTLHDLLQKCQNAPSTDINENDIKTCLHTSKDIALTEPNKSVLLDHISDLSQQESWTDFELSLLKHVCKQIPSEMMTDVEAVKMLKKAQDDDISLPTSYVGEVVKQDKALIETEEISSPEIDKIIAYTDMTAATTAREIILHAYHADIADMYWTRTYLATKYNELELLDYSEVAESSNVPDIQNKIKELDQQLQEQPDTIQQMQDDDDEPNTEQMQLTFDADTNLMKPEITLGADTVQAATETNTDQRPDVSQPMQVQESINIKFQYDMFKSIIIKRYSSRQS